MSHVNSTREEKTNKALLESKRTIVLRARVGLVIDEAMHDSLGEDKSRAHFAKDEEGLFVN